jgi:hypothetical protein
LPTGYILLPEASLRADRWTFANPSTTLLPDRDSLSWQALITPVRIEVNRCSGPIFSVSLGIPASRAAVSSPELGEGAPLPSNSLRKVSSFSTVMVSANDLTNEASEGQHVEP